MPRYNAAYGVSCSFNLNFFALGSEDPDTIADGLMQTIFGNTTATMFEQTTGSTSAVALTGSDVSGSNYAYVYTLNMPVGDASDTEYQQISAADITTALGYLRNIAARSASVNGMPIKLDYLKLI